MAERATIARPYAKAVFDTAREKNAFAAWSGMLALMRDIAAVPEMAAAIAHPEVDRQILLGIFFDLGGEAFSPEARNLLRILVKNRRTGLLPPIVEQYETRRAAEEKRGAALVLSARPLDSAQQERIRAALEKSLGRGLKLEAAVDERLLGGVVVRIGDQVIDGSALGRLERFARNLI